MIYTVKYTDYSVYQVEANSKAEAMENPQYGLKVGSGEKWEIEEKEEE